MDRQQTLDILRKLKPELVKRLIVTGFETPSRTFCKVKQDSLYETLSSMSMANRIEPFSAINFEPLFQRKN